MSWLHAQMAVLDAASVLAGLAVNWLLQSTLLILAGLAVGKFLARRGSAVQSVVYRTTLVAVLVCPVASWLLSHGGARGWSIELPAGWTYEALSEPLVAAEGPPDGALTPHGFTSRIEDLQPADVAAFGIAFPEAEPQAAAISVLASAAESGDGDATTDDEPAVNAPAVIALAEARQLSVHKIGLVFVGGSLLWVLVSAVLLGRLALAWRRLALLCRRAMIAEPAILQACHALASRLGTAPPEVLRSPYLPSPCLCGLRRPAILLTESEADPAVRDVLIHELAHLRRRDCHWNLLRRLATAVFCVQPLLWKLSRRLEATAEEVCDDYVV